MVHKASNIDTLLLGKEEIRLSIITSARNSNGKHDVKYVHKLNNSNTVDKTELNFKRTSEKSGKRY